MPRTVRRSIRTAVSRARASGSSRSVGPVAGSAGLEAAEVGRQVAGVDRSDAVDVAGGPEAEAVIGVVGPVDQVVPRLVAGSGEVGDLVLREAGGGRGGRSCGRYIASSTSSSTGRTSPACHCFQSERPLLEDEAVAGEVRRARGRGPGRGRLCQLIEGRAGGGEDQVERPAVEARGGSGRRPGGRRRGRGSARGPGASRGWKDWAPRLTRLTPPSARTSTLSRVERAGVGLDGPLAAVGQPEPAGGSSPGAGRAGRRSSRVGVPPPMKMVSTSGGSSPRAGPARGRGRRGSGRPGGRRRPARRSRSSRSLWAQKGTWT